MVTTDVQREEGTTIEGDKATPVLVKRANSKVGRKNIAGQRDGPVLGKLLPGQVIVSTGQLSPLHE